MEIYSTQSDLAEHEITVKVVLTNEELIKIKQHWPAGVGQVESWVSACFDVGSSTWFDTH